MERLGLSEATAIVDRQACAAAGQGALMRFYSALFDRLGLPCAQVLLTEDDFQNRRRYLNLAATLERLLDLNAVPIINENDTVSTAELALHGAAVFGDNDSLSALVASNLDADLLVMLSDVDGVFTRPPTEPEAERIATYGDAQARLAGTSAGGRGGMAAKVRAATMAARAGVQTVIASGFTPNGLARVVDGEDVGTWFPATGSMKSHRRWLAFATNPRGMLTVNAGARDAMLSRQASLLPKGVVGVSGNFSSGDVISVADELGVEFARGICSADAKEVMALAAAEGKQKALVHRDRVALLEEE
jgi:glutamate 5-kinase